MQEWGGALLGPCFKPLWREVRGALLAGNTVPTQALWGAAHLRAVCMRVSACAKVGRGCQAGALGQAFPPAHGYPQSTGSPPKSLPGSTAPSA